MPPVFATRRRRVLRPRTLVVVALVAGIAAAGFVVYDRRDADPPLPARELDAFLAAWQRGDGAAMAALVERPPADLGRVATSLVRSAPGSTATYAATGLVRDEQDPKTARAMYHARVELPGAGAVEWDGTITFVRMRPRDGETWRISWRDGVLHPELRAGEHLERRLTWPARGSILAADGTVLAGNRPVVTIGLQPGRATGSLDEIKAALGKLVGTDPASIDAALAAPGVRPNYFVPVATVPDDDRYRTVLRPQLAPLPGVFFRRREGVVATDVALGTSLVGTVGEITAEQLEKLGPPYRAGDVVGRSGLQEAFETHLAGSPRTDVVVAGREPPHVVKRFKGRAAGSVRLTVDPAIQRAAAQALAGSGNPPAALVAIDVATGQVRALVSRPDGGFNRAVAGTYEPGSTFKVVTAAALLANGITATTPAPCPATLTVHGRTFRNFEGEASTTLDLAGAFRISCNNAFIGLADRLPGGALTRAAERFGFNAASALPLGAKGGSYPDPVDRAELAASSIGQGRVLASPVHMASVAAAVAAGRWRAPVLTTVPKPAVPRVAPLDAPVVQALQAFMASVTQPGGTAASAGLPPGTAGKTGTAEFGDDRPPRTHAWFIGYRGSLAFAVVVEGGGVGGRVAAPLAAAFLNALP
jgi:cell division protein FtsI/penicillin-binding protein 2